MWVDLLPNLLLLTSDVVAEQSAGDKDDDIYDELLGLRLDNDWLTQPTSDQPGCLSSYIHTRIHTQAQTDIEPHTWSCFHH